MHVLIHSTHAHNSLSAYAREGTHGSSLFLVSRTQFNSSPAVGFKFFSKCGDPKHSFWPV